MRACVASGKAGRAPGSSPNSAHLPVLSLVQFMPIGTWYTPCYFAGHDCHRDLAVNRSGGLYKNDVVGYHHYVSVFFLF